MDTLALRQPAGTRVVVVADDYTGAADTGVQFSKHGLSTIVVTEPLELKGALGRFQVVSFDTATRNSSLREARKRVREALRCLKGAKVDILYKKVDSTIRGNIGAELDVLMDETTHDLCIVAPAFPANGRTTLEGRQLVDGIPVDQTPFAKDPLSPALDAHIPTLIGLQTRRKVGCLGIEVVRKGPEALASEFETRRQMGERIVVVDALTQKDLEAIALAAKALNVRLLCGSAGLAEELPYAFGLAAGGAALIVSGSLNAVTLRQIQNASGCPRTIVLEIALEKGLQRAELRRIARAGAEALRRGDRLIMAAAASEESAARAREALKGLGVRGGRLATRWLGAAAKEALRRQRPAGLILAGGETASQVIRALGASGLLLKGELEPGIPFGKILGGEHEGLKVVIKAGGFGRVESLINAAKRLEELMP